MLEDELLPPASILIEVGVDMINSVSLSVLFIHMVILGEIHYTKSFKHLTHQPISFCAMMLKNGVKPGLWTRGSVNKCVGGLG